MEGVVVVIGAGLIGQAIAAGSGSASTSCSRIRDVAENANAAAEVWRGS